jgi:hypothetical protein
MSPVLPKDNVAYLEHTSGAIGLIWEAGNPYPEGLVKRAAHLQYAQQTNLEATLCQDVSGLTATYS